MVSVNFAVRMIAWDELKLNRESKEKIILGGEAHMIAQSPKRSSRLRREGPPGCYGVWIYDECGYCGANLKLKDS